MRLFLDSSAMVKRYIDEPGSETVDTLCSQAMELGISVICLPEVVSALCRLIREGKLVSSQYRMLKQELVSDGEDSEILDISPGVISVATAVLEKTPSRAMDAIHIASAIQWNADLFVSSDLRQIASAEEFGLRVERV